MDGQLSDTSAELVELCARVAPSALNPAPLLWAAIGAAFLLCLFAYSPRRRRIKIIAVAGRPEELDCARRACEAEGIAVVDAHAPLRPLLEQPLKDKQTATRLFVRALMQTHVIQFNRTSQLLEKGCGRLVVLGGAKWVVEAAAAAHAHKLISAADLETVEAVAAQARQLVDRVYATASTRAPPRDAAPETLAQALDAGLSGMFEARSALLERVEPVDLATPEAARAALLGLFALPAERAV